MEKYNFKLLDSLQKVFPDQEPENLTEESKHFYTFYEDVISFQLAYTIEYDGVDIKSQEVDIVMESVISGKIKIRNVELIPSRLPVYYEQLDNNYLYTKPCLCPDLLVPVKSMKLKPVPYQWRALWFTIDINSKIDGGEYPVTVRIVKDGCSLWEDTIYLHVFAEKLAVQNLIHTEWFHADCLANYYNVPVFSEEHWRIIENFVDTAVRHGVNMLLTPIFTPPLDTQKGGERATVQLVKITKEAADYYRFDFSLLSKWISMCKRKGIKYIEICHLFTQWGAEYAPKIMVWEKNVEKKIFGWDTPAEGIEYQKFLHQFIPELKRFLKEEGVFQYTYFHISDEPDDKVKKSYEAARNSVKDLLADCKVIDALSSFDLYNEGVVEQPIVCNDHIQPFIDGKVDNLWTYYCCVQGYKVSNRFMAIPPVRNRILGIQLYLYKIQGFLHWGYNFYNAQYSQYPINPYLVTDADGAFPSGDPFVVYPAEDGTAYDSIRFEVFAEGLYDLRLLYKLEELTDRDYVVSLIQEGVKEKITFQEYPKDADYIRKLRKKIYEKIESLKKI